MKMFTKFSLILGLFLLFPFLGKSLVIPTQLKVAESISSGSWGDKTTWSDNRVPGDSSFVIIKAGHTVTLASNSSCESLVIEQNATLDNMTFELRIQLMGWAHGLNDVGVDDGVTYYGYAPIDNTWNINNPNNANWNMYKVDGTHAGNGNIIFSFFDGLSKDEFGVTVSGTGSITNTGSIFYRQSGGVTIGCKFNSACNLTFYGDINLTDDEYPVNGGGGLTAYNFGHINLKGAANLVAGAESGTFNNTPGSSIIIENGSFYIAPLTALANIFYNDGLIQIQNGNLYIPSQSYFMNSDSIIVNGSVLGIDATDPMCAFLQYNANCVLSVTGEIFPPTNIGTLTCYYAEPNYVIYNGTGPQNILVPTEVNDPGTVTPYSNLIINNTYGASINANITINGSLTVNTGAVLNINNTGSLTVNGALANNGGNTGLVVKSGGSLIESSIGVSATVESDIIANEWHLISSPVADAESGMFAGKYLQMHTESTNAYTDILLTNVPLTAAKGFALFSDAPYTAQYKGILNTADQSISLTRTAAGVLSGWNLVGNPYTSAIDWDAVSGWTKTNVNNATYIHASSSTWAAYVGGVGTGGGTNYIASCQGFFVNVKDDGSTSGILAIDNAVRLHNANSFFKNTVGNLVRLNISGNGYTDDAVVRFLPEATFGFDGNYDAHKFFGDVPEAAQLYTLGSTALAINTLPEANSVPVGVHGNTEGIYTIAATEVNDLADILLEDSKTGIITDLLQNTYTFNFAPGETETRFVLHFSPMTSVNETENLISGIYSSHGDVYVDLKNKAKADIYVYMITGQLVANVATVMGINKISLKKTGNYIVKVISDNSTIVKKVFVQ